LISGKTSESTSGSSAAAEERPWIIRTPVRSQQASVTWRRSRIDRREALAPSASASGVGTASLRLLWAGDMPST
jgi:hypothetical protein